MGNSVALDDRRRGPEDRRDLPRGGRRDTDRPEAHSAGYADMACPKCHKRGSRVTDSRAARTWIRRRRECLACGHRYTTREIYADDAARRVEVATRLGVIEDAVARLRDDLDLKH